HAVGLARSGRRCGRAPRRCLRLRPEDRRWASGGRRGPPGGRGRNRFQRVAVVGRARRVASPAGPMSAIDAVSDISHDALGALGTIRLAVTTVLEHGEDADLRTELLTAADGEAMRLVAD